jgi:Tfp pilus assembly protein PilN
VSRVNLLPTDIKKGQQVRRRTALVVIVGAVVLGVIVFFWALQGVRLSTINGDIDDQNRTNAQLRSEIDQLQRFEDLQTEAQQQAQLLGAAYAGEVAYSSVLVDVSKVIPSDQYLASFSSALEATAPQEQATPEQITFVGSMAFSSATLHFDSISTWLTRLGEVEGWVNPWTSNIAQDPEIVGAYTFDSTVDLTQDALTQRGKAGEVVSAGG